MIAGLGPYAEYKESGLSWLGRVPTHWEMRPAFGAFAPNHERNHGMKAKTVLSLILEAIDMDSYRVEKKAAMKIALADTDAEIEPVPTDARGHKPEPELDRLSNILKTFNEQFGTTFADSDRIFKHIRDDIAPKVAADAGFRNARANTPHTARMAHDQALGKAAQGSMKDLTQFYKQFVENDSFRRFVGDMVYQLSSQSPMRGPP